MSLYFEEEEDRCASDEVEGADLGVSTFFSLRVIRLGLPRKTRSVVDVRRRLFRSGLQDGRILFLLRPEVWIVVVGFSRYHVFLLVVFVVVVFLAGEKTIFALVTIGVALEKVLLVAPVFLE